MEINKNQPSLEELTAQSIVAGTPCNYMLRNRRLEIRLLQQELADMMGFKLGSSIGHFENLRAYPDCKTAYKLAYILDIDSQKLFPEWLKFHIKGRRKSELREIPETDVDPLEMKRAIEEGDLLTAVDPHDLVEQSDMIEQVNSILVDNLSEDEWSLINFRFGLNGHSSHTREEAAEAFNINPDDVWSIEGQIFRRLRYPSKNLRKLRELLDYY